MALSSHLGGFLAELYKRASAGEAAISLVEKAFLHKPKQVSFKILKFLAPRVEKLQTGEITKDLFALVRAKIWQKHQIDISRLTEAELRQRIDGDTIRKLINKYADEIMSAGVL